MIYAIGLIVVVLTGAALAFAAFFAFCAWLLKPPSVKPTIHPRDVVDRAGKPLAPGDRVQLFGKVVSIYIHAEKCSLTIELDPKKHWTEQTFSRQPSEVLRAD